MRLHATQLDPRREPSHVEALWRSLADASRPSYFLSWPWIENWLATLPRHVDVRLLSLASGSEPVAACFLGRRVLRRRGLISSQALFLNETGDDDVDAVVIEHNGWLVHPTCEVPLERLVEHLPGAWDELVLNAVAEHRLPRDTVLRWPTRLRVSSAKPSFFVDLEEVRSAKKGYLSLLGSETRAQIARSLRRYEARGPLVVDVAGDVATAREMFGELVALHEKTWAARGKPGAFSPHLRTFHERLIENRLPHGDIQLLRVRAGPHTIGCLYNFVWEGVVSFYQSGLAYERDNKLKPGLVCHAEAVRHNAAEGHQKYDFLAGDGRYKRSLSTSRTELVWAKVQKPRARFFIEDGLRSLRDHWRRMRPSPPAKPSSGPAVTDGPAA